MLWRLYYLLIDGLVLLGKAVGLFLLTVAIWLLLVAVMLPFAR